MYYRHLHSMNYRRMLMTHIFNNLPLGHKTPILFYSYIGVSLIISIIIFCLLHCSISIGYAVFFLNTKANLNLTILWSMIDYLRFYILFKNFSLWRRHHCRWRVAKYRSMLGSHGLWVRRDLYRATPAVTRGLVFSGLMRRTTLISRLLRHTWECGGSIFTRILTGPLVNTYFI
jgi:hypothetical protein